MPNLEELTIAAFQAGLAAGELSVRSVAEAYLARIEAIDRAGPALNAVIELNPEALTIADVLDAELRGRGPRGPLHGVPVLIKDNIDTGAQMLTTAGSLALEGHRAVADAFL